MAGLKQKECKVKRSNIKKCVMCSSDTLVASTVETMKLIECIPGKELKESLLQVISCNGITFVESDFVHMITENWYKGKYEGA